MYGGGPAADERALARAETTGFRKTKRPERTTSVPCHCIDVQQPGRGADPRYPLGPPLMLSPVALPGTVTLDGIFGLVPFDSPLGTRENIRLAPALTK